MAEENTEGVELPYLFIVYYNFKRFDFISAQFWAEGSGTKKLALNGKIRNCCNFFLLTYFANKLNTK